MTELDAVVEDWQRGLCVVAHPDDLEFGTAAAIARWTDQGKTIVYAMVTSGEAGIDGLEPEECRRGREAEQIASARIVGVDTVDFLGQPDGILEYGVALRAVICAAVRRYCPEIVITNNFRDTWGGTSLNQADHIATGKATLDAVRDAGNRWIFREQIEGPTGGSAATTGHSGELGQKGGGSAATTGHSGELGQKGGGSAATTGHSGELGQKGGGSAATTGHSGELGQKGGGSAATTGHSGELGQKGGGSAATTGHSGELGQKGGGSAATTGHSGELGQKGGGSAATTGHSGELGQKGGGSAATTGHSGELGQKGGGSAATTGHSGELGQKGGGSAATTGHSGELGQKGGGSAATTGHSGELGGMAPWGGVREVWAAGSPASTHGVETTATFARGVDSLRAHQAYIDGLGWELFDPEEFLEGAARPTGTRLGVPMATSFEVFRMGWGE